jgi:two-component system LytT family response regulator
VYKVQTQKRIPGIEQIQMLLNQLHRKEGFKKIAVTTTEGFELIPADQILRCEADDNYVYIFLKDKKGSLPAAH